MRNRNTVFSRRIVTAPRGTSTGQAARETATWKEAKEIAVPDGATFADGTPIVSVVRLPLSCEWFTRQKGQNCPPCALRPTSTTTGELLPRVILILPEDPERAQVAIAGLLDAIQSREGVSGAGLFEMPGEPQAWGMNLTD